MFFSALSSHDCWWDLALTLEPFHQIPPFFWVSVLCVVFVLQTRHIKQTLQDNPSQHNTVARYTCRKIRRIFTAKITCTLSKAVVKSFRNGKGIMSEPFMSPLSSIPLENNRAPTRSHLQVCISRQRSHVQARFKRHITSQAEILKVKSIRT